MEAYPEFTNLVSRLKRLDRIGSIGALISWDEQVNLPHGSTGLRAEQRAVFTEIAHREASHPEIGTLIEKVEAIGDQLDEAQKAVVRDARKDYDRLTKIPAAFAARKAKSQSLSFRAWVEAREENDFAAFQPHLEEQLKFAQEEAAIMEAPHPYNYWIDQFDPGMDCDTIDGLFGSLQPELKSIVDIILSSPNQPDTSIFKGFPVDKQDIFLREVVTAIGFDFNRGRLDTAVHPFCGGHGQDTRMTTRFHQDNPLDSLSSSMHETGHALYEQGLPDEYAGTALGEAVGMAVHESQSRLWENQVGRSREFWHCWEPRYREIFPDQLRNVSSEALYRAINKVGLTPIRVDADEVTYNLHIMLRFELERRLFDGTLSTKDLPEAWNEASTRILGYTPKNDTEGCMQDVHWSEGMFGYFPSYCLGNIVAGQLWYTIRDQIPQLEEQFASGNYQPLLKWLRDNVHSRGRRKFTLAFTKEVTGKDLSTEDLVRYLKERYLSLYTTS